MISRAGTPKLAEGKAGRSRMYGYDKSVYRVIALASVLIVLSILIVGTVVYLLTESAVVHKLKTKDLAVLSQSVSAKVDARIERAKETSRLLAGNPMIISWVRDGERDAALTGFAKQMLVDLPRDYDYNNSFIVGAATLHYWSETGTIIDTVSEKDPNDAWYFSTIRSGVPISVNFDYNAERNDTFVFVNALIGDPNRPDGIAGIGLSLKELSGEFEQYKYGSGSRLWLVDRTGKIYLSDKLEQDGKNIGDFLDRTIADRILSSFDDSSHVMEVNNQSGKLADLISDPIRSADLRLLVMIDRSETVAFLNNIKINTIAAILISIVSIVFFFFFVSRKLANPYKRALQLNMELEEKIAERTRELALRNEEMMDSIGYAKRIQESLLPNPESLDEMFREHFVIWTPKDQVGGDFFWVKRSPDGGMWAAVGDCTGHGVPGAFMTMLSVSMLDRILEQYPDATPAFVLERLNRMIKSTLHQEEADGLSDDGLDLGILFVQQGQMRFAGAKSHLFVRSADGTHVYTGDRKSIGYRRTPSDYRFAETVIPRSEGDVFYMASDGFFDQSGGEKGFSYGKRRFLELLDRIGGLPLHEQRDAVVNDTKTYRGKESIRDDVTLLAFRC